MLNSVLLGLLLLAAQASAPPAKAAPAAGPQMSVTSEQDDLDLERTFLKVRRIYVDSFGDEAVAKQIQAMVIASLSESKRFIITENKERADATLRGTALEKTSQEYHAYSEGTAAGAVGVSHGVGGGAAAAMEDSAAHTETVDHARMAVRLVDKDGDVIWASTQESKGAKYKGASADVAERLVKQLLRDIERTEKKLSGAATAPK